MMAADPRYHALLYTYTQLYCIAIPHQCCRCTPTEPLPAVHRDTTILGLLPHHCGNARIKRTRQTQIHRPVLVLVSPSSRPGTHCTAPCRKQASNVLLILIYQRTDTSYLPSFIIEHLSNRQSSYLSISMSIQLSIDLPISLYVYKLSFF
jgi:hypothetical protein